MPSGQVTYRIAAVILTWAVLVGVIVYGGGPATVMGAPVTVTVTGAATTVCCGAETCAAAVTVTVVGATVTVRAAAVTRGRTVTVTGGGTTVRAAGVRVLLGAVNMMVVGAIVAVGTAVGVGAEGPVPLVEVGTPLCPQVPDVLSTVLEEPRGTAVRGVAEPPPHSRSQETRNAVVEARAKAITSQARPERRRTGSSASAEATFGRTTNAGGDSPASGR